MVPDEGGYVSPICATCSAVQATSNSYTCLFMSTGANLFTDLSTQTEILQ